MVAEEVVEVMMIGEAAEDTMIDGEAEDSRTEVSGEEVLLNKLLTVIHLPTLQEVTETTGAEAEEVEVAMAVVEDTGTEGARRTTTTSA